MFLSLLTWPGITALRSKSSLCSTDYSPATPPVLLERGSATLLASTTPTRLLHLELVLVGGASRRARRGRSQQEREGGDYKYDSDGERKMEGASCANRAKENSSWRKESRGVARVIICPFVSAQEAPGEVRFLKNTGSGDARSAEPQHPNGI